MRILGISVLALLALSGCIHTHLPSIDEAMAHVRPFLDLPMQAAIARFGYPTEERSVLGKRLLVWKQRTAVPGSGPLLCELVMEVDGREVITHVELNGQVGACYF